MGASRLTALHFTILHNKKIFFTCKQEPDIFVVEAPEEEVIGQPDPCLFPTKCQC